jgi:hypothetical protein
VRRHGFFKLTVEAPKRTSGVVELPVKKGSKVVAKDGHRIRGVGRAARAAGFVQIKHVKGKHTFAVG